MERRGRAPALLVERAEKGAFAMRYMYLVKSANEEMPPKRLFEELDKMAEKAIKSGAMIDSGGLMPPHMGSAHVTLKSGKISVIDMPLAEGKEVVGGYAIFEFKTREEAIQSAIEFMDVHKRFHEGWEGTCEMRPMMSDPHNPPS
jgi:hypothetical protein